MTAEIDKRPLRSGWTTGTCATAAATAAYSAWLTGAFPDPVEVSLPRGQLATLALSRCRLAADGAEAGVIKDAGDDPDVTNGSEVIARIEPGPPGSGVVFRAGEGVGTVTLPGLQLPPGEPAINPGPRRMICSALAAIAATCGTAADCIVTVAVPGGVELAKKTLNGRLGITGGLSILGTTGIVVPFSCAAWIHSIHRGIDVACALGLEHLAAATGSVSEAAVQRLYGLADAALIDMGDFAGGTLKYLRTHPVPRLTLACGFGKLAKLAQGHLFLHSAKSRIDIGQLSGMLASLGAAPAVMAEASTAGSAAQVLALATAAQLPLADAVAKAARAEALRVLDSAAVRVDVLVFDRSGELVGASSPVGAGVQE